MVRGYMFCQLLVTQTRHVSLQPRLSVHPLSAYVGYPPQARNLNLDTFNLPNEHPVVAIVDSLTGPPGVFVRLYLFDWMPPPALTCRVASNQYPSLQHQPVSCGVQNLPSTAVTLSSWLFMLFKVAGRIQSKLLVKCHCVLSATGEGY